MLHLLLYAAAALVAAAAGVTVFVVLALIGSRKMRSEQESQADAMRAMRAQEGEQ